MRQLLKDLAVICAGQGAPQGDNNYCENGTPFVKAGNLQELLEGKAITSIQKVSDEVAKKHKLKLYPKGTILFAKSGMSCMKGYVYVLPQSAYVVSHLACVTPNEDASEYLRYFFNYHKPNQLVKDAAYPSISLSDIGNLVVDMKSESERNAIVSVLQHAESVITLRQKELQKLDELVKSRFIELFGDPKYNKSNLVKIGAIGALTSGGTPSRAKPEYFEGDIRWYSAGELNSLYLPDSVEHISEMALQQSSAKLFNKGTLMIGMYDTAAFKMGILTEDSSSNQACANLNPKQGYNIVWLYYLFDIMKPIFLQERQGVRQKNLSLSKIKEFEVPFAPFELQEQFATFVEQTDKSKLAIQESLAELETLKKALMQKYFG